jgi:hypothetical protein
MRGVFIVLALVTMNSTAHAQWTLDEMKQAGRQRCMAGGGSAEFCACWVDRWVGSWIDDDSYV